MPKRYGYIIEQIADMDNLRAADREAQEGKVKKNRYIRRHNLRAEEDLQDLRGMILTLRFPDPGYTSMTVVSDAGKRREIVKQSYFPWRILHHAIMRVIGPVLYRSLIYDTFACIKGKGLHFGVRRMKAMLRRYPHNAWFWKTDYKKFYQSIPHEAIRKALRRKFKDEKFMLLLEKTLFTYDSGEDILNILRDEEDRKQRSANWLIHQPAPGQSGRKLHRSLFERAPEGKVLPALLR